MAEGTVQDTIGDVETGLAYDDRHERYLGETEGPNYEQFEQTELNTGVQPETRQAEITAYNTPVGTASD